MKVYTAVELASNKWWISDYNAFLGKTPYGDLSISKNGKIKITYTKALPGLRIKKMVRYIEPHTGMKLGSF